MAYSNSYLPYFASSTTGPNPSLIHVYQRSGTSFSIDLPFDVLVPIRTDSGVINTDIATSDFVSTGNCDITYIGSDTRIYNLTYVISCAISSFAVNDLTFFLYLNDSTLLTPSAQYILADTNAVLSVTGNTFNSTSLSPGDVITLYTRASPSSPTIAITNFSLTINAIN